MRNIVEIKVDNTEYIQYNLSSQQLKDLIAAKFERARMYQEALIRREALLVESR
jgi:hypothetical protein